MVLNYKLTRSFSSDVHLNGISSDQVVLLQSIAVLFFAIAGSSKIRTDYFIIRDRDGFCPHSRLLQFHLPGLAALSISLAHLPLMDLGRLK